MPKLRKYVNKKYLYRNIIDNVIYRVIGQNVLVKTATVVEISTATAVISFLKEDTGWTKRVGKIV